MFVPEINLRISPHIHMGSIKEEGNIKDDLLKEN
jgi:hypothetical protein